MFDLQKQLAYYAGARAFRAGRSVLYNPYMEEDCSLSLWTVWFRGWLQAQREDAQS